MRIIGGRLKGLRLNPPKNLPVRPTTDMAKEALFNILQHYFDFEGLRVLDLFSGTGNIAMEFASRDAHRVLAVDRSRACIQFLREVADKQHLDAIKMVKADVFRFLQSETGHFDLIFADPPYDLARIPELPQLVFSRGLLRPGGLLVVEHQSLQNLRSHPRFIEQRSYGHSSFSFFREQESPPEESQQQPIADCPHR